MVNSISIAMGLHLLSAVLWVGGMFFAYMVLRPVADDLLEPPIRILLWCQSFARFFPWVWLAIIILLATGYWVVFAALGGWGHIGMHVLLMQLIGIPMILIFLHLYFAVYKRFKTAVVAQDWPRAGAQLTIIRTLVGINLVLGLSLVVIGSAGRYL